MTDLDPGKYQLALSQARKQLGLSMRPHFDESPRPCSRASTT